MFTLQEKLDNSLVWTLLCWECRNAPTMENNNKTRISPRYGNNTGVISLKNDLLKCFTRHGNLYLGEPHKTCWKLVIFHIWMKEKKLYFPLRQWFSTRSPLPTRWPLQISQDDLKSLVIKLKLKNTSAINNYSIKYCYTAITIVFY